MSLESECVLFQANGVVLIIFLQGNFQLVVKIKNWRSIFDEYLVDLIVENWELAVDRVESRSLTGLKGIATLAVSAQVTCINGKLCRNCTETCGEYIYKMFRQSIFNLNLECFS